MVNLVATEAYGFDATMRFQIMKSLAAEGNITLQHARYKEFQQPVNGVPTSNPALVGNKIERQPSVLYNAGLYYDDGHLDASIFTNYSGADYTASNNLIKLKGFNVVNLDAGYKFGIAGHQVRLGINVFNLFNTDATTEGSPRQDNNQTTGGAVLRRPSGAAAADRGTADGQLLELFRGTRLADPSPLIAGTHDHEPTSTPPRALSSRITTAAATPSPTAGSIRSSGTGISAFVALGFDAFDRDRAWTEIETLFRAQWDDGFLPHIVFWKDDPGYFPGPRVWGDRQGAGDVRHHPAAGCRNIVRNLWDSAKAAGEEDRYRARLEALFPKLLAWHRWFDDLSRL